MKKRFALLIAAMLSLLTAPAQTTTNDGFEALAKIITAKIKDGQTAESNFTAELTGFDTLLAAEHGAKTDEAARLIFAKGMFVLQAFHDTALAGDLMKKITRDYGDTTFSNYAANVSQQIEMFEMQKKIQARVEQIEAGIMPGKDFPDFAVKDLNGRPVSVGALKGRVVLVDFWATTCPVCMVELPNAIATYKKFHDQGFEIIGVNQDRNRVKMDEHLKKKPEMSWPQIYDIENNSSELGNQFGLLGLPAYILVGRDGKIIAAEHNGRVFGAKLRGDDLAASVASALKK